MSNVRTIAPIPLRPGMQTTPMLQQLQLGQIMTDVEARTALRRARQMQAQAIADFFVACARWLRGNPGSRARRISDTISSAGR